MENDILYLSLKNKICASIFTGIYKEGENIPPERVLAENFNLSRVTVRKSLALLEKDGIVERVQGSGTIVRLGETGYAGTMDIIALLAPAQKPFFSSFIDHFQKNAEKNDSLVLFKQNTQDERVEDSLFKLFQKNIRNVVIWLEDLKLDREYVRRLRGLGLNMVFFDIILPTPYADCVLLDNRHAITTLYHFLKGKGASNIAYVGWDNFGLSSVSEREHVFMELGGSEMDPVHFQWTEKNNLPDLAGKYIDELKKDNYFPDGIICGDGEIGIALKKSFLEHGIKNSFVVSVDDFPEASSLSLSVYMQSFDELAQEVYQCLLEQNMNARQWKASVRLVKGKLIER
jgi:DNA-binding LacI/PurR family transcriptional regulator